MSYNRGRLSHTAQCKWCLLELCNLVASISIWDSKACKATSLLEEKCWPLVTTSFCDWILKPVNNASVHSNLPVTVSLRFRTFWHRDLTFFQFPLQPHHTLRPHMTTSMADWWSEHAMCHPNCTPCSWSSFHLEYLLSRSKSYLIIDTQFASHSAEKASLSSPVQWYLSSVLQTPLQVCSPHLALYIKS